jgi:hypothetical protein
MKYAPHFIGQAFAESGRYEEDITIFNLTGSACFRPGFGESRQNVLDFFKVSSGTGNSAISNNPVKPVGNKSKIETVHLCERYAHVSNLGVDLIRESPAGVTLTVKPNRPEISQSSLQP